MKITVYTTSEIIYIMKNQNKNNDLPLLFVLFAPQSAEIKVIQIFDFPTLFRLSVFFDYSPRDTR